MGEWVGVQDGLNWDAQFINILLIKNLCDR